MKQETKEMPVTGHEKTDRNFQSTDKGLRDDKKQKAKLEPGKFPVEDAPLKNSK